MSPPSVLVIIPTHGHLDYACKAAWSLIEHSAERRDCKFEYVIVDDASPEWSSIDWSTWPESACPRMRFEERGGLTRSWNAGLLLARERSARYAICTNSDILFSRGWFGPLVSALEAGFELVGPVTNAPGHASWQQVLPFCSPDRPSLNDREENLDKVVTAITKNPTGTIEAPINGFFMMASTETWWKRSLTKEHVFNPRFPLQLNEEELQRRWQSAGCQIGFSPQSYIFHYRSVSRPGGLTGRLGRGAYRPAS